MYRYYKANAKSNTLGSVNRQDVIQEANKKRTLLKDSSWIKRQPEEEEEKIKDENFGKSILNRYKSQENLDRDNDKEEKTTIHNRFKSDDALDRISLRNTSERGNKSATLERIPMRKSWGPTNRSTTTTTTTETKPSQDLDNLIEVSSSRVVNNKGNQNVDDLIDIKPSVEKGAKSGAQNIDNLIDIKPTANRGAKSGAQNIDNLIDIKPTANRGAKRNQDLDDLIAITGEANKGTNKYPGNSSNTTTRSSTTTTTYNVTSETSDAPNRRSTTTRTYNVSNDSQDYSSRRSTPTSTYKYSDDNRDAPSRRSTTTTYRDVTDGPSTRSNVTYTQDSGISSSNTYGQSIVSNSIKTVYSTSDRSVIEKDMCTYCRKPLGIDAKMILTDLNICCHATCFKCEACSGPLGNLKAGDSMWIYKQTIHCEPCYFSAREKWIL
uniref:LIM zinc-binding domain-containing protein n=1 Tax=Pyxicephalus adspersus TaxID=30357 RepID=A0AAV3ANN5_PYXAD|nr:TPA: hypothetical protein GDO54_000793 [Pyxicephalus adspersus]